jgi:Tetracyclin repressor-like, C-terminal domain
LSNWSSLKSRSPGAPASGPTTFARPRTRREPHCWLTPTSSRCSARPPVTQPAFTLWESLTSILLDAGLSEEQAADGADCLGRLLIGHSLAEAGQPPGGDVGGEEEHRQVQAALAAARYPALSRVQQANIVHDPRRIFELALDGLILALQARHPHDL